MKTVGKFEPQRSIHAHLIACVAVCVLLIAGVGGWAATTELSGAVIAEGQLVVDSKVKKIQHPSGGVVGTLNVHEGDQVEVGDVLLRLDDTQTRANLSIIVKALTELMARKAREDAERNGADHIELPPELVANIGDPEVARVVDGEQRLFENRRSSRAGQKAQLRERITQLKEEITGLVSQEAGKASEIQWIRKELDGVRDLWSKNLVQFTRVTALERDAARIEGERGNVIASIAQARGKISEIELQVIQVDQDMRTEVGKDLADIRAKIAELVEKRVAAEDMLSRVDIRSPQKGVVHQLEANTVGGVIGPGQQIMLIVPSADMLMVEAKIRPQDIDLVHVGQSAFLRFTALNQRTTPEITGEVNLISADVVQDQKTGASYYTVRISVPQSEYARLDAHKLVPGMPVEVFLNTSERTVISYIMRPIHDQVAKAFREK